MNTGTGRPEKSTSGKGNTVAGKDDASKENAEIKLKDKEEEDGSSEQDEAAKGNVVRDNNEGISGAENQTDDETDDGSDDEADEEMEATLSGLQE